MKRINSFNQAIIVFILLISLLINSAIGNAQKQFKTPSNKMLVVSGGGARGAWGVGVASGLYQTQGGYRAVFGTSTGSLMSSFILLQKYDELEKAYSSVTQSDIFNQNPFKIKYNAATGEVTTKLRTFKVIKRLIFGKKTFGETKNLLKLIKRQITPEMYAELIRRAKENKMIVGMAVTNTRTGMLSLMTDSTYENTEVYRDSLCRWIWASANQPLLMSYTQMGNSFYVDGGVREVIPVQDAVKYAAANNIDTVDIIVNNSRIPISQNWDVNDGGIMNGLTRLLDIYDLSTVQYNENYAYLLNVYHNATGDLFAGPFAAAGNKIITLRFYFMPDSVAAKYDNSLAFIQGPMQDLIKEGKKYASENPNGSAITVDNVAQKKLESIIRSSK